MRKSVLLFVVIFQLFISSFLNAQQTDVAAIQKGYRLTIQKIQEKIKIDGDLSEAIWQQADVAKSFWRKFPTDGGKSKRQTEAKTAFDDNFLYVAFTVYDSGQAVIQSLKRDFGHDGQDVVAIVLDPVNRKTNGFFFVVNAYNAQSDDQLSAGGDISWSWDSKWYSATKRFADKWTAEIAIPFKTLRYAPDNLTWGINFVRVDTKTNEYSAWTPVPVNFPTMNMGFTGALIWKDAPPQPGSNLVLIPYLTGGVNSNVQNNQPSKATGNAGFDAKVALNSNLNLDVTVNPDFSQIEVDRQVTNLTRFNIFFPERRTFFLENSDLFANYGLDPIRPFYSRRIGLDVNNNKIPILFGARLSGNIAKRTRIGIMDMQTGKAGTYAAENYGAISISQQVLKRSTIKGYFLNRQGFLNDQQKKEDPLLQYGRNAGIEFNFSDLDGKWNAWSNYHHSIKPGISGKNGFVDIGSTYSVRKFSATVDYVNLGTNYYTDMGFIERIENYDALRDTVIRVGFQHLFLEASYAMFPKKGKINSHRFRQQNYIVWNPDGSLNEENYSLSYSLQFINTANLAVSLNKNKVNLLFPISFTDNTPLPAAQYNYHRFRLSYSSDFRKKITYSISTGLGQFYNGTNRQIAASFNFREQPHLNIGFDAEYNILKFPAPYGSAELLLIAPKIEINFTNTIFWTTFLQYNSQRNNFNINSRFQWRYKPMSDIFLVYTDNYFTDPFLQNKNRAIVFKMNYWLNL